MKKLFMLLFAIVSSVMTAMATDYTDNLIITVDGKTTTVNDTKITVTQQEDGKYSFSLKDFSFAGAKVGDIELNNIEGQEKDGIITLNVPETQIKIKNPAFLGTTINLAGGINFSMTAKISNVTNKMYADMTMTAIKQNIKAVYGNESNIIATGISNLPIDNSSEKVELYNLQGQRISEAKPGQVVIEKRGGKAVKKVMK